MHCPDMDNTEEQQQQHRAKDDGGWTRWGLGMPRTSEDLRERTNGHWSTHIPRLTRWPLIDAGGYHKTRVARYSRKSMRS